MDTATLHTAWLDSETDFDGFRAQARALLAAGIAPDALQWAVRSGDAPDLFATESPPLPPPDPDVPRPNVPPAFLALCETVLLHRDPGRLGLLYRMLWRLVHEPGLRHDPLDPDRVQAEHRGQAVRRDLHKMKAFVRFRTLPAPEGGPPLHVAWFEPEHRIAAAVAPFFARRFTAMRWAILTPDASVAWEPAPEAERGGATALEANGTLTVGPGADKADAPGADAGESLWLTYYASIFNPARLKLQMMQKEMPRKYWHNLPESVLIQPLAAAATARTGGMVEAEATVPARRIPPRPDLLASAPEEPMRAIDDLATLHRATDRCRECPIGQYATQSVTGEGPLGARLMVVGEQPGDQEDLRGRPFVGPAGQLFDRAVAELGWDRSRLFVTNAVKHFKFELRGKRRIHKTPNQQEVAACHHWLEDELRLVRPEGILALGATAARAVLGRPVAVMKERGQWHTDPAGRPVLVTLHPSALLRGDPAQRAEAFAAWLADLGQASRLAGG